MLPKWLMIVILLPETKHGLYSSYSVQDDSKLSRIELNTTLRHVGTESLKTHQENFRKVGVSHIVFK